MPPSCPNAHSVEARARSLAGTHDSWANAGSVRGRIVSDGSDWVLSLQIERATDRQGAAASALDGTPAGGTASEAASSSAVSSSPATSSPLAAPARVFRAHDCSELVEAAAVAIALALGGGDPEPPPAPEAPSAPPPPPAPVNDASDTVDSLASPVITTGAMARAEAVVDTDSLGGLALGAGVEVGVRWAALGLRAYGLGLPSRQIRLAPEQYIELSLWSAGLRGCYRVNDGLPLIDVCAGGEVGAFGAAGKGLIDSKVRRDVWTATTGGAWVGLELSEHLQAGARIEAVVPLSRERYFVNRNDMVHEMLGAGLRLALSVGGTLGAH